MNIRGLRLSVRAVASHSRVIANTVGNRHSNVDGGSAIAGGACLGIDGNEARVGGHQVVVQRDLRDLLRQFNVGIVSCAVDELRDVIARPHCG